MNETEALKRFGYELNDYLHFQGFYWDDIIKIAEKYGFQYWTPEDWEVLKKSEKFFQNPLYFNKDTKIGEVIVPTMDYTTVNNILNNYMAVIGGRGWIDGNMGIWKKGNKYFIIRMQSDEYVTYAYPEAIDF